MVRQMGGHIEVTSDRAAGTEFAILFPCFRQVAPARACVSAAPLVAAHPVILLVEDDEDVRMAVADMLGRQDMTFGSHAMGWMPWSICGRWPRRLHWFSRT